jgi:hypothetical protein
MGKHTAQLLGVDVMEELNAREPEKISNPNIYDIDEFADIMSDVIRESLKDTYINNEVHIEDAMAHVSMLVNAAFQTVSHFRR